MPNLYMDRMALLYESIYKWPESKDLLIMYEMIILRIMHGSG